MRLTVLFVSLLAMTGCRRRHAPPPSVDSGTAEAAKLLPFLPPKLGAFDARQIAMTDVMFTGRFSAERSYTSPDGREATVRISTGDLRGELATLESDDEHAFGSDTPTYWRTTSIAGHRTRIGEERPKPIKSVCYVRVGPNHVAEVDIRPAAGPGDCESVAALLDFTGIAATGGIPSPPSERR